MATDPTVAVPGVGKLKTKYAVAVLALVGGIVGVVWFRRRAADTAAATPVVDPATGSDTGSDTYTNPNPGNSGDAPASDGPTTDADWSQLVMNTLTWVDPDYLATTLGLYLDGQVLPDLEQRNLIREAWALDGKPPGNQQIITAQVGAPPPSGGGSSYPPPTGTGGHPVEPPTYTEAGFGTIVGKPPPRDPATILQMRK